MRNADHIVEGDVIVRPGATLRLEGTHLRVGGHVLVEQDGRLEMSPAASGRATRISALDETRGTWVDVEGSVQSSGTPATVVEGLGGDGLASALSGHGGIQIWGNGTLEDIRLANGTAGITVQRNASLTMRNATVERLGFIGIAAFGRLDLDAVAVLGHPMGVSGRETCDIRLHRSFIASTADNVLVYFCDVTVRDSALVGSAASLTANGHAHVVISNVTFEGYGTSGVTVKPSPSPTGGLGTPSLVMSDATLDPLPSARWGVESYSADATFLNVTAGGHAGHGIEAHGGTVRIDDSAFQANGEFGLFLRNAKLDGAGNDFGSALAGTANGKGAISQTVVFTARAVKADGSAVPGLTLEVFAGDGTLVYNRTETGRGSFQVAFEAYETGPDGAPNYLGPFHYRASHPNRTEPMEGEIVEAGHQLYVDIDFAAAQEAPGIGAPGVVLVALVAVALAAWFNAGSPRVGGPGWRSRRR